MAGNQWDGKRYADTRVYLVPGTQSTPVSGKTRQAEQPICCTAAYPVGLFYRVLVLVRSTCDHAPRGRIIVHRYLYSQHKTPDLSVVCMNYLRSPTLVFTRSMMFSSDYTDTSRDCDLDEEEKSVGALFSSFIAAHLANAKYLASSNEPG